MQSLTEWVAENQPARNLIFAKGFDKQLDVVRHLCGLLLSREVIEGEALSYADVFNRMLRVCSTHVSKSVTLPVYRVEWRGITFTLRYNFHDWKVSVSGLPDSIDFEDLFDITETVHPVYCEGFPGDCVFGSYYLDSTRFTCELRDHYDLFCFMRKIWYDVVCAVDLTSEDLS